MKKTLDIIKELFESRPIWLLIVIFDQIQKKGGNLQHAKRILPLIAFNYSNGPWRRCWVRWGYDPKLDPDSSVYQIIDFRIDHNVATNQNIKPVVVNPWRKKSKIINTYEFQTEKKLLTSSTVYAPPEYDYTFKEAPSKHNTLYQICDIDDPKIKDFFSKEQIQPSCNIKSGWYGAKTFREAYVIMKRKLGLIDNRMRFNRIESEVKGEDEITLMLADKIEDDNEAMLMRENLERMEDDINYVEEHEPFKIYDDDENDADEDIRTQMATIFGDEEEDEDDDEILLGDDDEDDDEDEDEDDDEEEEDDE